jgi:Ca-activated chloride channel family protein
MHRWITLRWWHLIVLTAVLLAACKQNQKLDESPMAVASTASDPVDKKAKAYVLEEAAHDGTRAKSDEHAPMAPAATGEPGGLGFKGGGAAGMRPRADTGGRGLTAPHRTQPAELGPPPPPVEEAVVDPNGRFATTYRPGGGHLAAFESAVARGVIPAAEREIVSDVGARYWTPMDAPTNRALALRTDFERAALPPSGGDVHMRLSLRSSDKAAAGRPHLSVHLVLDISGSMRGAPMDQAKMAAKALVDKLAGTDDFSLITFSSDAEVRVRDTRVAAAKARIKSTIDEIEATGGTNIGEGLRLGYEQAKSPSVPGDAVRVVLLLSDGRANSGITSPDRLSQLALEAFQDGIQTSTFGLGADYDGALMSSIAADGAGGYYYLRDGEQIAPALSTELDKRLDPAATAVEVRVRWNKGVDVLRVYGSRRLNAAEAARVRAIEVAADDHAAKRDNIKKDRQDDTEGGMRFLIPAFARDDNHVMLFKLRVPAGVGNQQVAMIELKYKDRVTKRNVSDEARVTVTYANGDAESAKSMQPAVARTVQGFAAGEALMEAARYVSHGDRARALALLSEREQILRKAAENLQEPGFARDADRLARLRTHMDARGGVGEPLVLAMLLETAGRAHLR